mgnify:CR=1 FL=1
MEYYEFHYLVKDLVDFIKKENEANKGQNDAASGAMSGIKTPNIKVPNIRVPKM